MRYRKTINWLAVAFKSAPTLLAWDCLLLIMLFLTRYHALFSRFYHWDEASMMTEAWAMMQGQVLYRDIPHVHPPFQFFIFVPFFLVLPNHLAPLAIRVMNALLVYFGAILMRRMIFSLYRDSWIANLSAILFIFYLGFHWSVSSHGEFYTVFPILLTSYFILTRESISNSMAFWIGLLWGTAFFIKQICIFDVIPLGIALVLLRKESVRSGLKVCLYTLPGIGVATVLAFLYPFWHGTVVETAQSILFRNMMLYISRDWDTSLYTAIGEFFVSYVHQAGYFLKEMAKVPVILFGLFPLFAAMSFATRLDDSLKPLWRRCLYCSVLWIAFIFIGLALTERFDQHYLIQLVTPLVLLYCTLTSGIGSSMKKGVVFVAVVLCLYSAGRLFVYEYHNRPLVRYEKERSSEIANFIRQNTKKNDTIFLFEECNLDIFYLSERLSPNGIYMYVAMDATHTNDTEGEREMRARLLKHLPRVIVWGTCLYDSPTKQFFAELVQNYYVFNKVVGGAKIYILK